VWACLFLPVVVGTPTLIYLCCIPTKTQGIGSGTSGGYIFTNVLLDYGGNLVGDKHGNFMGDMLGNGSQTVFDMYVDINTKK
jgi:hypothetical protein